MKKNIIYVAILVNFFLSSEPLGHLAPLIGVLHREGRHDLLDLFPHASVARVGADTLDNVGCHSSDVPAILVTGALPQNALYLLAHEVGIFEGFICGPCVGFALDIVA